MSQHNLPLQLSSFIGRERDLDAIRQSLKTARLMTLYGAGGSGKTRLAIEVASTYGRTQSGTPRFSDGVWLVEFAPLADSNFVPQTIAAALGIPEQPDRPILSVLTEHLRGKQALLLLDNCEHLIEAVSRLAEAVLHASAEIRILATSREPLSISGETTYRVPSLSVPNPTTVYSLADLKGFDAVRLFIERATAALPDFALNTGNASAVAQICGRLDGIPLAIELAAARVRTLRVEQIAERLDDRFRLLTSGSRTALPRQQTLRGMIDWSHSLLSEPERVLWRRLSVFAGGWTLEAAEAVCAGGEIDSAEVMELLTRLIDKSLVVVDPVAVEPRYRMLETLLQYALEKLREAAEELTIRNRHLSYWAQWAEAAEPKLHGTLQTVWFERLEVDYDNLRVAMDWSLLHAETVEEGLRLAGSLWWFWWNRAHASEGQDRLVKILSRAGPAARSISRLKALNAAAAMQWSQGHYTEAHPYLAEALAIGHGLSDKQHLATSLQFQGVVLFDQGEYASARVALEAALTIRRGLGDAWGVGFLLGNLGDIAFIQDDYAWAQSVGEEALKVLTALNENSVIPYTYRQLGRLALYRGDYANAIRLCKESLRINAMARDVRGMAACVAALAGVAAAQGQGVRAAKLLSAAEAAVTAIATPFLPADRKAINRTLIIVHGQLDGTLFDKTWREGSSLTLEEAMREAETIGADSTRSNLATPVPVGAAVAVGLSAREIEVLRLLAQGLSNDQIAEALVISPRTVNAHLRSIYGKLDVTTRTAAARVAIDQKLI